MSPVGESDSKRKPSRRKKLMVDPGFQWKYASLAVLAVFVMSSTMTIVIFGVLHEQAVASARHPGTAESFNNSLAMMGSAVAFSAVIALVLAIWTVVITRRICGPLGVMQRYLSDLIDGRFPKWRLLRSTDEFQAVNVLFGRAIDELRSRRETELRSLNEALRLAKGTQSADANRRQKSMQKLNECITKLRAEVASSLGESLMMEEPARKRSHRTKVTSDRSEA